jgi:hypothetical protein
MRSRLPLLWLACSTLGCYGGVDDTPRSEIRDDAEGVDDEVADDEPAAARTLQHPASGWIELESSPVLPWCGAVLVAPDVVVTSASCLDGYHHSFMDVGFGAVATRRYGIAEVEIQADVDPREHALAALRLDEPVQGVQPVELDTARSRACGVQAVSYLFVVRGDAGSRWLWEGCLANGRLVATAGAPNCHGDLGAGAFMADGSLAGITIDAWTEGGCAPGQILATVADNEAFFDLALDLSRPD